MDRRLTLQVCRVVEAGDIRVVEATRAQGVIRAVVAIRVGQLQFNL